MLKDIIRNFWLIKRKEERIEKIIHLGEKSPTYASMPERQIILLKKFLEIHLSFI